MVGCRWITGYLAVPIFDPVARPSLGKLARRPGESGRLTHNTTQS